MPAVRFSSTSTPDERIRSTTSRKSAGSREGPPVSGSRTWMCTIAAPAVRPRAPRRRSARSHRHELGPVRRRPDSRHGTGDEDLGVHRLGLYDRSEALSLSAVSSPSPFPRLLSPLSLRGRTLRNRVVFTAHTASFSQDGIPGPRAPAYYAARAAGGAGMIVMEPLPVFSSAGVTPQNYRFDDAALRSRATGGGRRGPCPRHRLRLPGLPPRGERRPLRDERERWSAREGLHQAAVPVNAPHRHARHRGADRRSRARGPHGARRRRRRSRVHVRLRHARRRVHVRGPQPTLGSIRGFAREPDAARPRDPRHAAHGDR